MSDQFGKDDSRRGRPAAGPQAARLRAAGARTAGEAGFGLLESLAGLAVFMLLAIVGTKAYRGAVANQKESAQVKALTDAVATTSETLAGLGETALIGAGSPYLQWSEPVQVGQGPTHFRFRTIPRPTVGGKVDSVLVGLEVETGTVKGKAFTASRSFATLITPNTARNAQGQASTQAERDEEAVFYAGNQARIAAMAARVTRDNQVKLNSFSCYNKGECCGFMREYFANPAIQAADGLKSKCLYRCALGGDVPMAEWKRACGFDFCTIAPWKTKQQCCTAILSGDCKPGSACARVCLDCVGVDGRTCAIDACTEPVFNDYFDCVKGQLCDGRGTALPETPVAGWGDIRFICGVEECQAVASRCEDTPHSCCENYWEPLARGEPIDPRNEICAKISSRNDCCGPENREGLWEFACDRNGNTAAGRFNGQWYCGTDNIFPNIDKYCAVYRACGTSTRYGKEGGGGCINWTGRRLANVWDNPNPPSGSGFPPTGNGGGQPPGGGGPDKPKPGASDPGPGRTPANRSGSVIGSGGGRE